MTSEEQRLAIVERYRRNLPKGTLTDFPIRGLDRLEVFVHLSSQKLESGAMFDGYGYGATPAEAMIGSFGELSETVHCDTWLQRQEPMHANYRELVDNFGERVVADPLTLCLPAGSDYTEDTPLFWVTAHRYPTEEKVLVPLELAAVRGTQMRGQKPILQPITNGLGAGVSKAMALGHSLLELLQRDGNCTSFRAMDQGVAIELDEVIAPDLRLLLNHMEENGIRLLPKLAATDFEMTNLYVVGWDQPEYADHIIPIQTTACGEAVHPSRERALRKAILEFGAARIRKAFSHGPLDRVEKTAPSGYLDRYRSAFDPKTQESKSLKTMAEWCSLDRGTFVERLADTVFATKSTVDLSSLPNTPIESVSAPEDRLERVATQLIEKGHDILCFDMSPPGGEVFVTKAVVTGLECETMSYYRIGERGVRRLLQMESPILGQGVAPVGTLPVRLTQVAEERLGGPSYIDPRRIDDIVGPLYP